MKNTYSTTNFLAIQNILALAYLIFNSFIYAGWLRVGGYLKCPDGYNCALVSITNSTRLSVLYILAGLFILNLIIFVIYKLVKIKLD